ncbi:MAG: hypothetical protein KDJ47_16900 [Hyphomicrobiaceae bacterium]|nr:hypothetical protein [Hyphomicrobiaceae bacterium]
MMLRTLAALVISGQCLTAALAETPFDCSGLNDINAVTALIAKQTSCQDAARIYRGCARNWTNSPDMEDATLQLCAETFYQRLTPRQQAAYDDIAEACVVKNQDPQSMRVFWPTVRDCRIKAAEDYARRFAAPVAVAPASASGKH